MSRQRLRPALRQSMRSARGLDTRPLYYVATTGNDTTGTGAIGAPWATINKAVTTVPLTGARVIVAAGTYAENTSGLNYLFVTRQFTGLCTVEAASGASVTLTNNAATTYCVRLNGANNIEFRDLTITPPNSIDRGTVYFQATASTGIRFANCIIEGWGLAAVETAVLTVSIANVLLDGCTLKRATGQALVQRTLYARIGNAGYLGLTLTNCTSTGTGTEAVDVQLSHAAGDFDLTINGSDSSYTNTSDYALWVQGGNVVIGDGVTFSATSAPALVIGVDGVGTYVTTGTVGAIVASSGSSHAVINGGASAVDGSGAIIDGGDYGLVMKECDGSLWTDVNASGASTAAVYFKAAKNSGVTNSEIAAAQGACILVIFNDGNGNEPNANLTVTGNTVTATGSADIFNWGDASSDEGGSVCDSNTYDISGTTGNIGDVYGTTSITNLAGLQAAWDTYNVPTNDDNSVVTP